LSILPPPERRFLLLVAALLTGVGAAAAHREGLLGGVPTAPAIIVASAPVSRFADTLRARETVGQLFARRGVSGVDWSAITRAVRAFDPSRVRQGMVFTFAQRHGEAQPHAVAVRLSYDERLHLLRGLAGDGWTAEVERIRWRTEPLVLEGEVTTSVSDAITEAVADDVLPREERIALVWRLAEVYDWVVDFSRDVQSGDRFRLLAERLVSAEGDVRLGRVLATRLDVGPRPLYAFRFDAPDGRPEYYDEHGRSMRRELLRAPLEYRRIASRFSRSRFHPILRYRRPHNGIDFSAAYGAPVRAVGDGVVTQAGRGGGYGNLVEIRHSGARTTRYAHLSRFASGVHPGARVRQGETIGYVGASGLATSPHLHYELLVGGRFVNPVRRQFAAGQGEPIPASRRVAFEGERDRLREMLEPRTADQLPLARVD
jgi:murein DD-endopeptidase MepM/ murein hydrolase activator NlpD